jgi:hypothetical protein
VLHEVRILGVDEPGDLAITHPEEYQAARRLGSQVAEEAALRTCGSDAGH